MTKQEFLNALGAEKLSPRFDRLYTECMAAMKGEGTGFLSPKFVQSLQDELHIFHEKLDFVLEYAQKVCEHPALSRLGFLLTKTFDKRHGDDIIALSELPSCPHGVNPVLFEMTVFLSQFAFVTELKLYYRWRGVSDDVLSAMLTECFEAPLIASEKTLGREGYDVVGLFEQTERYLNHSIFNQRLAR
jgi:hypothetical protein